MDLKETPVGKLSNQPKPRPRGIPNLGRKIFASTFWTILFGGMGYVLFSYTKDMGTEQSRKRRELERMQGTADKTPGKQQLIMDTLLGQGPASLSELREITTKKRYKIAEENATYAVQTEEKSKDLDENLKSESVDKPKEVKIN